MGKLTTTIQILGDPNIKPKQIITLLNIFEYVLNTNSFILNPFFVVVANIETLFSYKSNRFNINTFSSTFELFFFTIYVCNNDFKYIASLEMSVAVEVLYDKTLQ